MNLKVMKSNPTSDDGAFPPIEKFKQVFIMCPEKGKLQSNLLTSSLTMTQQVHTVSPRVHLRFMSSVTELEIGATRLLLDAWHVKMTLRCFLWRRSMWSTFLTFLSSVCSSVSSKSAFSCHHVTFGRGRPEISCNGDMTILWLNLPPVASQVMLIESSSL